MRNIRAKKRFIKAGSGRWRRMTHKREKKGCRGEKTDCRYCYDSLSGFVCNFYGDGPGTRTTETQMRWSESPTHFHSALTGPFRDDDPRVSAPLWDGLTQGIIGFDSWVMGLKQRNNLCSLLLHFPHISVTLPSRCTISRCITAPLPVTLKNSLWINTDFHTIAQDVRRNRRHFHSSCLFLLEKGRF